MRGLSISEALEFASDFHGGGASSVTIVMTERDGSTSIVTREFADDRTAAEIADHAHNAVREFVGDTIPQRETRMFSDVVEQGAATAVSVKTPAFRRQDIGRAFGEPIDFEPILP